MLFVSGQNMFSIFDKSHNLAGWGRCWCSFCCW